MESKNPERNASWFLQKYWAAQLFSTLTMIRKFFEQETIILEWFLKNNDAENSDLNHRKKYILKYVQIENSCLNYNNNNIYKYDCCYGFRIKKTAILINIETFAEPKIWKLNESYTSHTDPFPMNFN